MKNDFVGSVKVKRIMICHGMNGINNLDKYVNHVRCVVFDYYNDKGDIIEIINTYYRDFNGNRLEFLGKSILEGIAIADEIVFIDDWINYSGCMCEHYIAKQYDIPIIYLKSNYDDYLLEEYINNKGD